MNELDMVARLGAADAALDAVDKEIQALERRVPAAEAELAAAVADRDGAAKALAAARAEEKRLDAEVATVRQRRTSAERALDHGLGDAQAVQHQITTCDAQIESLETRQLEVMEDIERLTARVARAEGVARTSTSTLAETRLATAPLLEACKAKRAIAAADREAAWAGVRPDLQSRYAVVRSRRRTAITTAAGGFCTQCSVAIPRQELIDLGKGLLRSCPGCSRYIVEA